MPPPTAPPSFSLAVEVGDGRTLDVRCIGTGSPTILLEAGGESDLDSWPIQLVARLGSETTTCRYSRAGYGRSSPLDGPWTMAQTASDFFTMLDELRATGRIEAPYLLVGWSLGGSIALGEALTRPDETAGLVILDTDFPIDFLAVCPTLGRTEADCRGEYEEDKLAKDLEAEVAHAVHPLPDIPIRIISAGEIDCEVGGGCPDRAREIAEQQLRDWSQLGPLVTQTIGDGDHDSMVTHDLAGMLRVILGALAEARANLAAG